MKYFYINYSINQDFLAGLIFGAFFIAVSIYLIDWKYRKTHKTLKQVLYVLNGVVAISKTSQNGNLVVKRLNYQYLLRILSETLHISILTPSQRIRRFFKKFRKGTKKVNKTK